MCHSVNELHCVIIGAVVSVNFCLEEQGNFLLCMCVWVCITSIYRYIIHTAIGRGNC